MTSPFARVLLVVLVAALVGGAAYAFSESQAQEYQAVTRLAYGEFLSPELRVLGPNFGEPSVDEETRIATAAAQVNSYDVALATAKDAPELGLGPRTIEALVNAEPVRGSLVVAVTATESMPEKANRLADAYVGSYRKLLRERERRGARQVERALERRLAGLPPGDKEGLRGAQLRDQISQLAVLGRVGTRSPQVIEKATASGSPAQPQTQRNVIFGVLFGLAVGIGLVALRSESRSRAAAAADRQASRLARRGPLQDR